MLHYPLLPSETILANSGMNFYRHKGSMREGNRALTVNIFQYHVHVYTCRVLLSAMNVFIMHVLSSPGLGASVG